MKKFYSKRRIAIITGASLVLMTLTAGLAMGLVFNSLFSASPIEFEENWLKVEGLFSIALGAWLLILILDIIVSWGVYSFYRENASKLPVVSAILRLIYSGILAFGISKLVRLAIILGQDSYQLQDVYALINDFHSIWQFGLIIFGFHLLTLSPLVFSGNWLLKVISSLIFLAGIGYIVTNLAIFIDPNSKSYLGNLESLFMLPMIAGELGWAIWLWLRGGKAN